MNRTPLRRALLLGLTAIAGLVVVVAIACGSGEVEELRAQLADQQATIEALEEELEAASGDSATATRTPRATRTATPRATLPTATTSPPWAPTVAPTRTPTVVPTAAATPEPTPTRPPREPVTKASKLGVGVYMPGGGHVLDMMIASEPGIILLMEPNPSFARSVRRYFPNAFIIGRRDLFEQPLDNPTQQGIEAADYVAELAVPLGDTIDAWMGYNEVTRSGDFAQYEAYNEFQVAFANQLQDVHGFPAVAANDAIGVIQPQEYATYFAEAIEASDYFGVRAYPPEGSLDLDDDAVWYMLRYRMIKQELDRAGVSHGPFVITESGAADGWRGKISAEEMTDQFFWYTRELEQDDYMLGHAIFGIFGLGEQIWDGWNLNGGPILGLLGEFEPEAAPEW